jgi:hypothetical protein
MVLLLHMLSDEICQRLIEEAGDTGIVNSEFSYRTLIFLIYVHSSTAISLDHVTTFDIWTSLFPFPSMCHLHECSVYFSFLL